MLVKLVIWLYGIVVLFRYVICVWCANSNAAHALYDISVVQGSDLGTNHAFVQGCLVVLTLVYGV